ncbi:MAG: hypothetical protein ACKO9H_07860, partial [Planctomycetota bacterium]
FRNLASPAPANTPSLSGRALAAGGREYSLATKGLLSPSVASDPKAHNASPFALTCLRNRELVA